MLKKVKLQDPRAVIFLDIETVPEVQQSERWSYKKAQTRTERYCKNMPVDSCECERYREQAWLFPEYGKIVCISMGYLGENGEMKMKSYMWKETELLKNFIDDLENCLSKILWWHNVINFDIPFIMKRLLINGMKLPRMLWFVDCKPWEVNVIDTMKLWKLTWWVSTGLEVLCEVLEVKSPKETLSWREVKNVYYDWNSESEEERMTKIKEYCEADVRATAECYRKLYWLMCYE